MVEMNWTCNQTSCTVSYFQLCYATCVFDIALPKTINYKSPDKKTTEKGVQAPNLIMAKSHLG